jgi:hypothetical protein
LSLWRRAPWWRATVIGAAAITVAATVFWAESQSRSSTAAAVSTPEKAAPSAASTAAIRTANESLAGPQGPASAQQPSTGTPDQQPASTPGSGEDEQTQAMCHPHLLSAPPSMPQVDVAQTPEPNLGHIKVHLWVNGTGVVTREVLTASTLGTPAEQEAETAYAKGLTFALPNTKECRSREVEVIGDFFERREQTGRWSTYVRLYPRFTFNATGALQRAD